MENLIYLIGLLVTTLLAVYIVFYFLYRILELKVDPVISIDSMPGLRPVPIPTKNQKSLIHKLVAFIFKVRKWELVENWHYKLADEVELVIPKGFRFDGASIPRPFWALLSPVGLLLIPGLLHDYGYKYDQIWRVGSEGCPEAYMKGAGKDYWDQLFKTVGEKVNGVSLVNAIAWFAVAVGVSGTWKRRREADLKPTEPVLVGCSQHESLKEGKGGQAEVTPV